MTWSLRVWTVRITLLVSLTLSSDLSGQAPYERFRKLSDQGTPDELRTFSLEMSALDSVALAQLARGTAFYREAAFGGTISVMDSIIRSTSTNDPRILATARKFRSMALAKLGLPAQAVLEASEGLKRISDGTMDPEQVDLLIIRAEAFISATEFEKALDDLSVARQIADRSNYERGECLIIFTMASIAYKQARYDKASSEFESAAACAMSVKAEKLAMNALSNLGSVAIMQKDHDRALHLFDSVLNASTYVSPALRSHIIAQRGFIRQKAGDHQRALTDLELAIAIRDSIGDQVGMIKVLQHASTSYWKTGLKPLALATLRAALQLSDSSSQSNTSSEIHRKLSEWYDELGDGALAMYHLKRYSHLSDSLNLAKFNNSIADREVLFETERKERLISEQDQSLALAATENRRRSIQRNALIGSTVLAAIIALLLYRTMRARQRLANKEKELHNEKIDQLLGQQEMKSINAMLEGQEQERARVSKELHDHVGHLLGTIKHQLGQLEEQVADVRSEQTAQYRKVTGLLDNAAGALRRISHDMAAATLNRFGLEKALKDLRDTIHINGRLQVELNTYGLEHPLERGVEIAVYRIIQEAVSNVLKHAQANEMSIAVTHAPGRMSVLVSDNGQGFDTNQTSHGVGLANIRSRAAALGAQVQIDSAPGKGTTISVECPVME